MSGAGLSSLLRTGAVNWRFYALCTTATLLAVTSSAAALSQDEVKPMQFGLGCVGRLERFGPGLGTCAIPGDKARIWCPSGKVFERDAEWHRSSYVVRAICGLNQIPDLP